MTDVVAAFHDAGVGGPLRSLERELGWLSESCQVEILLPEEGRQAPDFERLAATVTRGPYSALTVGRSPLELGRDLARTARERRWFREVLLDRRPRLVLAVTSALPAFMLAARGAEVPAMLWVGELWLGAGRGRLREAAARRMLRKELEIAARVIACSEAVARQFNGSPKVAVIHPGIDESRSRGSGAPFRSANGIAPEAPLIACVGNITRGRGQRTLLHALPALLERWPALRCVIEGRPFPHERALESELHELAVQLGVAASVVWTSGAEPVGDLLAAAEVIVNPPDAHAESFGRVPLEAGLAGTPSVCTRVGAIPELHTDGETALLISPGDADQLAAAVARLLEDPELGARLASGAAELARRIASPERSLAEFRAVVEAQLGS